jgi:uncharacterized delta-60 repeat protein
MKRLSFLTCCLSLAFLFAALTGKSQASVKIEDSVIYLPLVTGKSPITPEAPLLSPISNADGDGSYTVNWSSSEGASAYILQEDDNTSFSSPTTAYSGSSISTDINGRDMDTYYYRVNASNTSGASDWSNVESVEVSVALPECPQTYAWRGLNSQDSFINFGVEDSPQCQIATSSLNISFTDGCDANRTTVFKYSVPITNNHFDTGVGAGTRVIGDFTSPTTASGTFSYESETGTCPVSGTWTAEINLGANGTVYALALQTDGKIVVGGIFSTLGGQLRSRIGRLNPDGSLDTTFNPGANGVVYALAVQPDNKIIVGGYFTEVGGQTRNNIARLNADGTIDTSFNPDANDYVSALVVQPDGKILLSGYFTVLGGVHRDYLGRLNSDGSVDLGFVCDRNSKPNTIALQADGKFLAGFSAGFADDSASVLRWYADGTSDSSFYGYVEGFFMDTHVYSLLVQPDGKVVAGGYFNEMEGEDVTNIGRFTSDGNLDPDFVPGTETGWVRAMALQPDGKIIKGGAFKFTYTGHLGRLNPDGTPDATFSKPGVNREVFAIMVQPDGKIVVGGSFSLLGDELHYFIGRLNPDGTLDTSFP